MNQAVCSLAGRASYWILRFDMCPGPDGVEVKGECSTFTPFDFLEERSNNARQQFLVAVEPAVEILPDQLAHIKPRLHRTAAQVGREHDVLHRY